MGFFGLLRAAIMAAKGERRKQIAATMSWASVLRFYYYDFFVYSRRVNMGEEIWCGWLVLLVCFENVVNLGHFMEQTRVDEISVVVWFWIEASCRSSLQKKYRRVSMFIQWTGTGFESGWRSNNFEHRDHLRLYIRRTWYTEFFQKRVSEVEKIMFFGYFQYNGTCNSRIFGLLRI